MGQKEVGSSGEGERDRETGIVNVGLMQNGTCIIIIMMIIGT